MSAAQIAASLRSTGGMDTARSSATEYIQAKHSRGNSIAGRAAFRPRQGRIAASWPGRGRLPTAWAPEPRDSDRYEAPVSLDEATSGPSQIANPKLRGGEAFRDPDRNACSWVSAI